MDTIVFTSSWYLAARNLFITLLVVNFLLGGIALLNTVSFNEPLTYRALLVAALDIKQLALFILPLELLFSFVLVSGGYIEVRGDTDAIVIHRPYALFGRTQVVLLAAMQSVTLKSFKTRYFIFQQRTGKQSSIGFDFLPNEALKMFAAFLRAHAVTPVNF